MTDDEIDEAIRAACERRTEPSRDRAIWRAAHAVGLLSAERMLRALADVMKVVAEKE